LIETAAAIFVVGGAIGLIQTVFVDLAAVDLSAGLPPTVILGIVLDGLSVAVGLLIRSGRSWVLSLNVAAVYAFLYLSSLPNPVGLAFGLADLFVVGILVYRRAWFDAMAAWRATLPGQARPVR
jgi:hypothetical protein